MSLSSRIILIALILVVVSTWITPLQRELFIGDETKYAQVVREMRATGAFFLPTLNGAPFTHKPPLHFWMIDRLTFPLGVYSLWAFVLPSLIAFLFLEWLMWRMGGPLAAFICGTSLMIWGSAQTARMDMSFTALIVLGAWMLQNDKLLPAAIALGTAANTLFIAAFIERGFEAFQASAEAMGREMESHVRGIGRSGNGEWAANRAQEGARPQS